MCWRLHTACIPIHANVRKNIVSSKGEKRKIHCDTTVLISRPQEAVCLLRRKAYSSRHLTFPFSFSFFFFFFFFFFFLFSFILFNQMTKVTVHLGRNIDPLYVALYRISSQHHLLDPEQVAHFWTNNLPVRGQRAG